MAILLNLVKHRPLNAETSSRHTRLPSHSTPVTLDSRHTRLNNNQLRQCRRYFTKLQLPQTPTFYHQKSSPARRHHGRVNSYAWPSPAVTRRPSSPARPIYPSSTYNVANSGNSTPATRHRQHDTGNTTLATQHWQHDIGNTTPATRHRQHDTGNTTPATRHRQHDTDNTTLPTQYWQHNTGDPTYYAIRPGVFI
ncbi:hypothetical protein LSAT2_008870 [Lamellibrachia satsuma]|nr:hypothetical protein LSAT2_008870 [Lamellibrachia satsuma]